MPKFKKLARILHIYLCKVFLQEFIMPKTNYSSNEDNILVMYLKDINKIPLLSREEEQALAERAAKGDKIAKDKIVTANLRFVVNVAKKYMNRGLEIDDLISEGNIGLLTAIERFDPSKGYHFISYAIWWIRQSILRAISEKSRMIRLPQNRENELMQIEKVRHSIDNDKSEDEKIVEIAETLGMEDSLVRELLIISRDMVSLDSPVSDKSNSGATITDFIEDTEMTSPEENAIYSTMKDDITDVLETLSTKEATILRYHYGLQGDKAMSLKEIGEVFNLTKERIRQIEKKAISRLQHPTRMNRLASYVA